MSCEAQRDLVFARACQPLNQRQNQRNRPNRDFETPHAKRGVFAYIIDGHPEELQSAIDITLRRFADVGSLQHAIERRNAEGLREQEVARARQRQALELHDGVVQGLVAAQLAHDLGRKGESRKALLEALERAKAVVNRSLEELKSTGLSTEQLIRDTASHR